MLLFLVGLELEPHKLWQIRKRILGLGLSQMLLSIVGIFFVFYVIDVLHVAIDNVLRVVGDGNGLVFKNRLRREKRFISVNKMVEE